MFLARLNQSLKSCGQFRSSAYNARSYVSVQEFYKDRNVFITGSTGFVGQCLVEKLIRSCPDIGRIYLPIRATRKGDTGKRYEQYLNNPVFENLRQNSPNFDAKLVPLAAKLEEPNLGLSDKEYGHLLDDVSVIFHVAALIKLSPPPSYIAAAGSHDHGFLYFKDQYFHDILSEHPAAHLTLVYDYTPIGERQMSERMSAAVRTRAIQDPWIRKVETFRLK